MLGTFTFIEKPSLGTFVCFGYIFYRKFVFGTIFSYKTMVKEHLFLRKKYFGHIFLQLNGFGTNFV